MCDGLVQYSSSSIVCDGLVQDCSSSIVCDGLVQDFSSSIVCDGLVQDSSNSIVCDGLVQDCSSSIVCDGLVQYSSNSIVCDGLVQDSSNSIMCDGLVQDSSNSSADALELLQSCTKPSIQSPSVPCLEPVCYPPHSNISHHTIWYAAGALYHTVHLSWYLIHLVLCCIRAPQIMVAICQRKAHCINNLLEKDILH